jgi:hypothetical protein
MMTILVVLFSVLAMATGEQPDCNTITNPADQTLVETANQFLQTCSDVSYTKPPVPKDGKFFLGRMTARSPKDICDCIKENKFTEIRVPEKTKRKFNGTKINESIGKNIAFAINDLLGNITKFKNANLPDNLHEKAKGMCNAASIITKITSLKDKPGTSDCPGSKDNFDSRIKDIFGETKPEEFAQKYRQFNLGVDDKSCISRQKYLHNKSASLKNDRRVGLQTNTVDNLADFFLNENLVPDVSTGMSYDLFFSIGLRDPSFKLKMRDVINKDYKSFDKHIANKLYTNPDALELAYNSLEDNCSDLSKQIKTFLCAEKTPALNSQNISLAVNQSLSSRIEDDRTDQSVREFFVKRYACTEGNSEALDDDFNKFFETTALLRRATYDPVSTDEDSEYSQFNKTFCKGREGKLATNDDYRLMMKEFFESKNAQGIDIMSILAGPSLKGQLNFTIDPDAIPPFKKRDSQDGTILPEVSRQSWDFVSRELISKGLTKVESDQLYSIIEMQTNIRKAEISAVRERLFNTDIDYAFITDGEIDGILRNDPAVISGVSARNRRMTDPVTKVSTVFQNQEQNRAERFDLDNMPSSASIKTSVQNMADGVSAKVTQKVETSRPESSSEGKPQATEAKPTASLTVTSINTSPGYNSAGATTSNIPSSSSISSSTSSSSGSSSSYPSTDYSNSSDTSSFSGRGNSTSGSTAMNDDLKNMQAEIDRNRAQYENARRKFNNSSTQVARSNNTGRIQGNSRSSSYRYPKNLPVKTEDGDYYTPSAQGSELSSASEAKDAQSDSSSGSGGGSSTAKGDVVGASGSGGASFGSGGVASSGNGRGPASQTGATLDVMKNLAVFEFNKYLPHSVFDVMGSIDKVILLLGLEGKSFKTIEAIEETDAATGKIKIKYFEHTFDFVPEGKYEKFRDLFQTKETRMEAFKQYFSFPRNKENLPLSKKYSLATKELKKEEVSHSYVLNIQNYILSDEEIRDTMARTMELTK